MLPVCSYTDSDSSERTVMAFCPQGKSYVLCVAEFTNKQKEIFRILEKFGKIEANQDR